MQHKFLKIAGVKTEEEFYNKFPTSEHFFKAFPDKDSNKVAYSKYGGNLNKYALGGDLCLDDYGVEIDCITRQPKQRLENEFIPAQNNHEPAPFDPAGALEDQELNKQKTNRDNWESDPRNELSVLDKNGLGILPPVPDYDPKKTYDPFKPQTETSQFQTERKFGTPNLTNIKLFGALTAGLQTYANGVDRNRQQDYINEQKGNMLYSNLAPISGQSYGVKYGYEKYKYGGHLTKFQDGGALPEDNTNEEQDDFDAVDFLDLLKEKNAAKDLPTVTSADDVEKAQNDAEELRQQRRKNNYQTAMNIIYSNNGDNSGENNVNNKLPSNYTPQSTSNFLEKSTAFAKANNFDITSTTNGSHNKGSKHYQGLAIDVRTRNKTPQQLLDFKASAQQNGFKVHDETTRPKGQAVWNGPHFHLESFKEGGTYDINPLEIMHLKKLGYNIKMV